MAEVEVAEEVFEATVITRSNSVSPAPEDDYGIVPWELDPIGGGDADVDADVDTDKIGEGWTRKAYNELQEKPEWRQRDIQELRTVVQGKSKVYRVGHTDDVQGAA
jgi:hypothetical protein